LIRDSRVWARSLVPNRYISVCFVANLFSRDYKAVVVKWLESMRFAALYTFPCLFNQILIMYNFVDDFVFTGANNKVVIEEFVNQFLAIVTTTPAVWNCDKDLGMMLVRNRDTRAIQINRTHNTINKKNQWINQ
jgi:hypothetical protein